MEEWACKNLGDAMFAAEHLDALEKRYAGVYGKETPPGDAAVFYRHASEGRLHCEVLVYFSPAAADLARSCGAEPCEAPSRSGLSLLAGPAGAWQTLFPSSGG